VLKSNFTVEEEDGSTHSQAPSLR